MAGVLILHHMPLIKTAAVLGLGKVRLRVVDGGRKRNKSEGVEGMEVERTIVG